VDTTRGPYLASSFFGDGGVDGVPGDPVELVDDDVVDVFVLFDPGQHLLEDGALLDVGGGTAGFDELTGDVGNEGLAFEGAGVALSGKGDAFGVVVGLDL